MQSVLKEIAGGAFEITSATVTEYRGVCTNSHRTILPILLERIPASAINADANGPIRSILFQIATPGPVTIVRRLSLLA